MNIYVKIATTAACLLTLVGCASTGISPASKIIPGAPYALSPAEQEIIKKGVISVLKDPTSALFGIMQASKSADGVVTVCGYVNGKNAYGGYVGDKPYAGVLTGGDKPSGFVVAAMGGVDTETYATYSVCRQSGISI